MSCIKTLFSLTMAGVRSSSIGSAQPNQAIPVEKLSPRQKDNPYIEGRFFEAINNKDSKAPGRLLATDFVYRSPRQPESGRAEFLKAIVSVPIKIIALWEEEMKVNVYDETATLTGLQMAITRNEDARKKQARLCSLMFFEKAASAGF